ncbi:MAG: hypothetical protein ABIJ16_13180 [Bacteroidota bacterium]
MKNLLITLAGLIFITGAISGQGKKTIIANGVKTKTEWKYDYKTGTEKKIKQSETKFDAAGNEIEVKEYDDYGKVKSWVKTEYNADGDVVKEQELGADKSVKKTTVYKYSNGLKTEKIVYDDKNKVKSKKSWDYTK